MTNFFGRNLQTACRVLSLGISVFCAAGIAHAALEITEIMNNPISSFDNVWEWIEVRNTDLINDVDLDGWVAFRIGDGEILSPQPTVNSGKASNTVIPAGKTAIIYDGTQALFPSFEPNDASFRTAWSLDPNIPVIAADHFPQLSNTLGSQFQSIGFWENVSNYQADLIPNPDPNSPIVNVVGSFNNANFSIDYRSGFPTDESSPGTGQSIYWKGVGSNADGSTWGVSTAGVFGAYQSVPVQAVGTINNTNDIANPGLLPSGSFDPNGPALHITEIMFAPASSNNDWEWVELYNSSTSPINITGYILDDNGLVELFACSLRKTGGKRNYP
jgi:hypothetical protein